MIGYYLVNGLSALIGFLFCNQIWLMSCAKPVNLIAGNFAALVFVAVMAVALNHAHNHPEGA